jgi:hypothetical protein
MNDITQHWRFQRILREAAEYRALRRMLLEVARRPADDATITPPRIPLAGDDLKTSSNRNFDDVVAPLGLTPGGFSMEKYACLKARRLEMTTGTGHPLRLQNGP